MKKLSLKLLFVFFAGSLFFISCSDDDNKSSNITETLTTDETMAVVESNDVSDEVNHFIDDLFVTEFDLGERTAKYNYGQTDCFTKTVEIDGATKVVTIDFGEGCEMPNGNILSGKIILTYEYNSDLNMVTVVYTYDNFYFNDISVVGETTIVRVKENENVNPESTITFNIKLTWPDETYVVQEGTKVREWIEGYDTRDLTDNVFLITGSWSTTYSDGTVCSVTVIEPLRREMICKYIVSGIIEITKNNVTFTLNYGDGTCDNIAVITDALGNTTEIIISGRNKNS